MDILIVNDYGILVNNIQKLINEIYTYNCYTFVAHSKKESMGMMNNNTNLIIADYSLPDSSGSDFVKYVRHSNNNIKDTPIILISLNDNEDKLKEVCNKYDNVEYLLKPLNIEELKNALISLNLL